MGLEGIVIGRSTCLPALAALAVLCVTLRAEVINITRGGPPYDTVQSAVSAAQPGDSLLVLPGTYALTNSVNLDKAGLSLRGVGTNEAMILAPDVANGTALAIAAPNVTVENLQIRLPRKDNTRLVYVDADGATVRGNLLWGDWNVGDGAVSIGIYLRSSGGVSNFTIAGNVIHSLRQPGQIHGSRTNGLGFTESSGTVVSNHVYNTKGWTIWGGGRVTWLGNTFGSGGTNRWGTSLGTGDQVNIGDIAVLSYVPTNYYIDIVVLSRSNDACVVEDQRPSPAVLSVAYADPASAGGNGVRFEPYATLTQAVGRAAWGALVRALPGAYTDRVTLAKSLTFELAASVPVAQFDMIAAAPSGFVFRGWTGDTGGCVIAGGHITVVLNTNRTIAGTFTPAQVGALIQVR